MNANKKIASYYAKLVVSNQLVRSVIRFLHIDQIGKKLFFKIFGPKDNTISREINGVKTQFYVKNYNEFIYLTQTSVGVGDETEMIKALLDEIRPGDIIYDVGAFLGLHTIFFAKKTGASGKVVAFEPAKENSTSLQKNIEINNLNNVIVLDVALGESIGVGIMKPEDMIMHEASGEKNHGQSTRIVPGDLLIQERDLPSPNIIKIDVEGYEYSVIKGLESALKKDACRIVCCEIHPTLLPQGITPETVIGLLKECGFSRVKTSPRGSTFHAFFYKN